jgi:ABC-2 type transport system permease protein
VTALFAVEARRVLARRITKVLLLVGLAAIVLVGILVFVNTSDTVTATTDDRFVATDLVKDSEGDVGIVAGVAPFAILFVLLLSASLVGAEWRAGTIGVLLTWEPRRGRVLLTKAAAAALAGAVLVLVLELLLIGALWPSAVLHGTTAGTDAEFWRGLGGALLRTGFAGGVVALIGFSFASVGRNTATALGGVVVYFVIIENVIRTFASGWARWFFSDNLFVVILGGAEDADTDFSTTVTSSALLLAGYAAAFLLIALAWFRARDVA